MSAVRGGETGGLHFSEAEISRLIRPIGNSDNKLMSFSINVIKRAWEIVNSFDACLGCTRCLVLS